MVWEEAYVNGTRLQKDTIVQLWKYRKNGSNVMLLAKKLQGLLIDILKDGNYSIPSKSFLDAGHFVVMNAHYYLDNRAIGYHNRPAWYKDFRHDFRYK